SQERTDAVCRTLNPALRKQPMRVASKIWHRQLNRGSVRPNSVT
ncbi:MAG: hypothetical protein ACJAYN_003413, partial [Bermanella sp.]